ncbi:hypothetical protein C8R44DRAFT_716847 [Mycena epipterygia]|nr:hypothetical protein C8R44DRAFT_716847 [Mycena epipterygia]
MEALHDSVERFPAPACHPGTRTDVLAELRSWSVDTSPESALLWLYGSAGVGKSAIAQMFAGECQKQGRLGASFFFRRGHPKRGTWHGLWTTIAYQLAKSVPEFLVYLQQAVDSDKLVVGRAIEVQFQQLLVEPFCHIQPPQLLPVLVLDGLDECEDHNMQLQILRLFVGAIRHHQLPVRLIIISRPEPNLREILETKDALTMCRSVVLAADQSAYDDIRTYLRDAFSRIHSDSMARGIDLGDDWPPSGALDHLVKKSSGIFIYATTVIRFVGDEYRHPADRLTCVLSLDPLTTAPLDDLYTEILSLLPQEPEQLRILHAIWEGTLDADPEEIDLLLALRRGTCRLALRGLHSLFYVPPICTLFSLRKEVTLLHASMADYLRDPRRSGGWCLSKQWLDSDYLHCIIRVLSSPPLTDSIRAFHVEIISALPKLLRTAAPSKHLFDLLRNADFQNSVFLNLVDKVELNAGPWPQRDSPYPSDLTGLWEDHLFVSIFARRLKLSENRSSPTYKFDPIYTEILSKDHTLLFILQTQLVLPATLYNSLRLLGSTCNYRLFQPFCAFRQLFESLWPMGDSPLDFLTDPDRAGDLYTDPQDTLEEVLLLHIDRTKEFLITGGCCWFYLHWLSHLPECRKTPRIVCELETLDLSKICDQLKDDPEAHGTVHYEILHPGTLSRILNWLQEFPDPPVQPIALWEKQMDAMVGCHNSF